MTNALVALSDNCLGGSGEWSQPLDRKVPNYYYYGEHRNPSEGPQGFLVSRDPNEVTRAHFHHLNQFQIFLGAPGATFQRHEIGRLLVHYTDAETVYGPFAAGEQGLRFLTLRPKGANFIGFLPENKEDLLPRPTRRHQEVQLDAWLDEQLPPPGESVTSEIFARQADGLFAMKVAAGAGAKIEGLSPLDGGGQYIAVVSGSVNSEDADFSRLSIGWRKPTEGPANFIAGDDGARVLYMQFPLHSAS